MSDDQSINTAATSRRGSATASAKPSTPADVDGDPWAPVSLDVLPLPLVRAVDSGDWPTARQELSRVMDGLTTDGPYGRALLQLVKRLPLGVDPVFDRYRGAVAIDHGEWDELRACLASSPIEKRELEMLRDTLLASIDRVRARPDESPQVSPFAAYDFQFSGRYGWYRRWIRRIPTWDASGRWLRQDIPAGRHFRFRVLHHCVLRASAEAHAGNLKLAIALAAEGKRLGDAGEPLRDIAGDIELLASLAAGDAVKRSKPRLFARNASAVGMSPLGTFEWLLHVVPFLQLLHDDSTTRAALLMQRIAGRLASPQAQLHAETWVTAAHGLNTGSWSRSGVTAVLEQARRADPGLRALPQLLSGIASIKYSAFADAERTARTVANVWVQVAALVWMVAIDPSPRAARSLFRLLAGAGWRRPLFVPTDVLGDAVLGLLTQGHRGQCLIELALAAGKANVTTEVASRHLTEPTTPQDVRLAALEALGRVGTTHARAVIAEASRQPDEVGRSARTALARRNRVADLSSREVEVVDLAARGMTNREIALALTLSPHTVARHLANARDKLGATNRADAAVRLGRLMTEEPRAPGR